MGVGRDEGLLGDREAGRLAVARADVVFSQGLVAVDGVGREDLDVRQWAQA
ncbi:MAG: hypothetical protein IPH09_12285 [bacterium]|nr:hypothetical protein [bacterium]MBK7702210.1 hypothetical protein [bacterium]